MIRQRPTTLSFLAITLFFNAGAMTQAADPPTPTTTTRPAEAEIKRTIRQLGHPSPKQRDKAVQQLAAWGPAVLTQLRQAANSDDLESALLARELIQQLGDTVLIGTQVRPELVRTRVAWDEPINLTVHVFNPTAAAIRVPWPAPTDPPTSQPDNNDADQVGAMLDVADFLVVTGPDGQPVQLRVDPIERDSKVAEAVNVRADHDPPSHLVAAQNEAHLTIPLFNRGWARYPMLAVGRYTITLSYQPQWKNEAWTRQGLGLVRADPVTLEITKACPAAIRNAKKEMVLNLRQEGDFVVAELQNTWDRAQWVNLNLSGACDTHARLEWRPLSPDKNEAVEIKSDPTSPTFSIHQLKKLLPSQKIIIAKTPTAALAKLIAASGNGTKQPPQLTARYIHLLRPQELQRKLHEIGQTETVPTHLFAGIVNSEPITLKTPE